MAELRNCPKCDRLFSYVNRNLCPKCIEEEEIDYEVVRKYVREHPGAGIKDTAEATGVDEEKILQFLRDGRLISRGLKSSVIIRCERCGKIIEAGRYCESCLYQLDRDLRRNIRPSRRTDDQEITVTRTGERIHIMDLKTDTKDTKKPGR